MVIASVLRFYKGGISYVDIWDMTLRQIAGMMEQAEIIAQMESGEKKVYLEGPAAAAYLKSWARKGKKK